MQELTSEYSEGVKCKLICEPSVTVNVEYDANVHLHETGW